MREDSQAAQRDRDGRRGDLGTVGPARSFPALAEDLHRIRGYVRAEAEQGSISPDAVDELVLAVSEACANAVLHSGCRDVSVHLEILGDRIVVSVEDEGTFVKRVVMPELGEQGGRGIPIMMAMTDEFSIREGSDREPGTVIRLVKYAPQGAGFESTGRIP